MRHLYKALALALICFLIVFIGLSMFVYLVNMISFMFTLGLYIIIAFLGMVLAFYLYFKSRS
jgi:UPF0716 family protein affecting phage T7 exclusion